jgi:general stress protein YciG
MDGSAANQPEPTQAQGEESSPPSRPRGFAGMTPEQRRALGSKGGRTAHARGTANKFTPETASVAGRRPHENGTAHKWTSEEAREAGRKGGSALRRRRTPAPPSPEGTSNEG